MEPSAHAVVDRHAERALARILVAVDGSPTAMAALEQAERCGVSVAQKLLTLSTCPVLLTRG